MAVFWLVALRSLVEVYRRLRDDLPDDGWGKGLRKVNTLLLEYTAP
jgi:hypothetical protein